MEIINERKIGEIFEYNGEWYQCSDLERGGCSECGFEHILCEKIKSVRGECLKSKRKDRKSAIFKKLEKVGETYEKRISDGTSSTFQRYRVYNSVILPKEPYIYCNFIDGTIEIEIKQTKEDMEEKKLKLKPFDLEAAKAGKPVCTRDGRKARIICFDRRLFYKNVSYPILALVECSDGEDDVCGYNEKGKVLIEDGAEYKDDLMMQPEKKEGWVNVYRNQIHNTPESAEEGHRGITDYIKTIRVEWEE